MHATPRRRRTDGERWGGGKEWIWWRSSSSSSPPVPHQEEGEVSGIAKAGRSLFFPPPPTDGRHFFLLLLQPHALSSPWVATIYERKRGERGEAALRTESWWGGLRSKAQLKRSKLGGGRMGQVGGRKGHLPSFHFFLCYSPAAATTTSCAPSLPSPANHHHQGWGGRKLLKSDVPWPKRERGGRNGPWTDAQPGRRRRAVQEKGKKEKQPTSKSNQTVLFILPLFHPNCPPPSSPRFRVLHPPGQSVKRGNGEKRRGSPSVFLPLAIVLSRRRGRRGHEIFKHSIWLRCLSSFPFLLSFHPLSTGRKEKQGGGETGQHRETSPLSFPSASNSPTPAAAAR